MAVYARVVNSVVAEVFTVPTPFYISQCFNPGIPGSWIECDGTPGVAQQWTYNGSAFQAPVTP